MEVRENMREHHKKTIENLVAHFRDDKAFHALIIAGSVAKEREGSDADVDIYLVAIDEEFERRTAENDFHYSINDTRICVSPCAYVDGKVVNLQFLRDAAKRGSEPARASFLGAFIAYSHIPDVEKLLSRIPVYQEHERIEKMRSFYSQVVNLRWYIGEAEKRNDKYLLAHSAAELVLFGGRMILAYNRILYPYHKWFMHELRHAPQKPDCIIDLAEHLLKSPCKNNGDLFSDCIMTFTEWEKLIGRVNPFSQFIADSEWNWRHRKPPVQDL
jgi:hypothetical protein